MPAIPRNLNRLIRQKSMAAFHTAMRDYEILFLHNKRGICWMRGACVSLDIDTTTLRQALLYTRSRGFIQLDDTSPTRGAFATMNFWQCRKLAQYILDLSVEFGSLFLLRYYRSLNPCEIELLSNTRYAKGKVEYFRRLFTGRLGLEHLISDQSLGEACRLAVRKVLLK